MLGPRLMRVEVIALVLALRLQHVRSCSNDSVCASHCLGAGGQSCSGVFCATLYTRCDCNDGAVLRLDGTCEVAPSDTATCTPAYNATWAAASFAGPELSLEDLEAGVASEKLKNLLVLGTAGATGLAAKQVAVSDVRLVTSPDLNMSAPASLVLYDLIFAFCTADPSQKVQPAAFDVGFRGALQQYVAFGVGTSLALLQLNSLTGVEATTTEASAAGPSVEGEDEASPSSRPDTGMDIAIFLSIAGAAVLVSALVVGVWSWQRRKRWKVTSAENGAKEDEENPAQHEEIQRVLAHVASAFSPTDVEDDKVFRESCLELSEGDIVEVIAGGGGWFYGRVISTSTEGQQVERLGYFPENRVSWMGKIPSTGVPCEAHEIVTVEHGFSIEDMAGAPEMAESALHLESGEVVEVLAGGGGWLFGQVVGHPERCGYFPENRATSLGVGACEAEAAKTEGGNQLVQVVQNFSPGVPGDPEEEVTFGDCCIALAEGDVVEVAAAGGGWIYGRVVGAPERVGYFPETRVSWLGRPVAEMQESFETAPSDASQAAPAGPAEATSPLPPGWVQRTSKQKGKTYYLCESTGKTTWTRPSAASNEPSEALAPLPSGWVERYSEKKGKTYYLCESTGKTTWARPTASGGDALEPTSPMSGIQESSEAEATAPLPPGWVERRSEKKGKTYYLCESTGETTWERPTAVNSDGADPSRTLSDDQEQALRAAAAAAVEAANTNPPCES